MSTDNHHSASNLLAELICPLSGTSARAEETQKMGPNKTLMTTNCSPAPGRVTRSKCQSAEGLSMVSWESSQEMGLLRKGVRRNGDSMILRTRWDEDWAG